MKFGLYPPRDIPTTGVRIGPRNRSLCPQCTHRDGLPIA